jgi:hypothetical protein
VGFFSISFVPLDWPLGVLKVIASEHEFGGTIVLQRDQESTNLVLDLTFCLEAFKVSP